MLHYAVFQTQHTRKNGNYGVTTFKQKTQLENENEQKKQ